MPERRNVADVEKRVTPRVSLRDRSASACCSPPRCGSTLAAAFAESRLPVYRRSAIAAVTLQILGDHRPDLPVALGRDAKHASRRGGSWVGRRDHRARPQCHGLTVRAEHFSCQRGLKDTAREITGKGKVDEIEWDGNGVDRAAAG